VWQVALGAVAAAVVLTAAAGCGGDHSETTADRAAQERIDEFLKLADERCTQFVSDLRETRSGTEAAIAIDRFVSTVNDFATFEIGAGTVDDLSEVGAELGDRFDGRQGALSRQQREEIYSRMVAAAEQADISCPSLDR
jgi:hypothetical protein